ncbi:carboxy-S-adenosyl-L-methionine synthase CmoA [Balneatrix alpica]|uniref:Carboxy-S-adenosyl-L-methionine synthase n=1 Tax=Balneatrix alpica TaxID=75684 RepID=A0ABV5ZC35_9GAMM|nr:carboxy-S-adenosyl-L-methionine synthase CmoA [Balneatrix alpica]
MQDRIYAEPQQRVSQFAFDEAVARVFPDMIRRSVPGYTTIIPMIELISARYAQAGTNLYDLGCSLGASTLAMRHGVKDKACQIIGVDNSEAMLNQCRQYVQEDSASAPVELVLGDIRQQPIENASLVTLNFTLQFLPPADRGPLLASIYAGLQPGGVLLLSEKVCFPEPEQSLQEVLHHDFKRANGYSDLEISQKRNALENVLITESLDTHKERLRQLGFAQVWVWYQCFNFVSMLAVKL